MYKYQEKRSSYMKKALAIFMIAAFAACAVVMYMYWHQDSDIVDKGVLVWRECYGF